MGETKEPSYAKMTLSQCHPTPCLRVSLSAHLRVSVSPRLPVSASPRLLSTTRSSILLNVVPVNPRVFLGAVASLEENLLFIFASY